MKHWKVITLGTSHGDPTAERFNVSTLLLSPDGDGYLVDAGTPALALLIRGGFDMRRLKAVIVTHMHEDHFGGVPDLLKFQSKRLPDGYHTGFYFPEAAALEGMRNFMALTHRPLYEGKVSLLCYDESWNYTDGTLTLRALATEHFSNENLSFPSYALRCSLNGRTLLLTGDLARDFHDFPQGIAADLAFCELTHYDLEKALPTLAAQKFGKLVFTHIGNEWHGTEGEARFAQLISALPYPAHLARDGECFEV